MSYRNHQQQHQQQQKSANDNLSSSTGSGIKYAYRGVLNCDKYGGLSKEIEQEMVYWEDTPSDRPDFKKKYAAKMIAAAKAEEAIGS